MERDGVEVLGITPPREGGPGEGGRGEGAELLGGVAGVNPPPPCEGGPGLRKMGGGRRLGTETRVKAQPTLLSPPTDRILAAAHPPLHTTSHTVQPSSSHSTPENLSVHTGAHPRCPHLVVGAAYLVLQVGLAPPPTLHASHFTFHTPHLGRPPPMPASG